MSYMTSQRTGKTITKEEIESLYKVMLNNRTLHNEDNTGNGFTEEKAEELFNNHINNIVPLDTTMIIVNDYGFRFSNILFDAGYKDINVVFIAFKAKNKKATYYTEVSGRSMYDTAVRFATKIFNNKIKVLSLEEFYKMKDRKTKVLVNPPYGSVGGPVIATMLTALPDADLSVLMPVSCYESALVNGSPLYQYVKTIKTVGWTGDSAKVTKNNSIATFNKVPNKSVRFVEDFMFNSFDDRYKEFYKYNMEHYCGYCLNQTSYKSAEDFDIATTFIEGSRVCSYNGGGFTCDGFGYKYNALKDATVKLAAGLGIMECKTAHAKDMISLWAYNYNGDKSKALSTKVMWGIKQTTVSSTYFMYIPQISWDDIDVRQKTLWDAGDYDGAVLAEMGLKWEGDRIVKA